MPSSAQSEAAAVEVNIPAGSLDQALNQYAQAAGVLLIIDAELTAGRQSAGLSGSYTPNQGFATLLQGTGLEVIQQGNGSYNLRRSARPAERVSQMPVVRVEAAVEEHGPMLAYAGGQVAKGGRVGFLGDRDVMDTPFNMTAFTAELIADQQATSLGAVLDNDPSVRSPWPSGSYTETLTIRGFPVSSLSYAVNGLYGVLPSGGGAGGGILVGTEFLERLEVLKGPSAMLNGMPPGGSIGGAINVTTKRATDEPITRFTGQYFSDAQFGAHADVGRRLGDGQRWGVRLNAAYREGDAYSNFQQQRNGSAMVGVDYRGDRFRASLDVAYLNQREDAPVRPVLFGNAVTEIPKAPDASKSINQKWEYWKVDSSLAVGRIEYDLAEHWLAYAAAGVNEYQWDSLNGFLTLANVNGDGTARVRRLPGFGRSNSEELGIRGVFETAALTHELAINATRFDSSYGTLATDVVSFASNLYNPVFIDEPGTTGTDDAPRTSETRLESVGIVDVISAYGGKVQLTAGLRYQRVDNENFSPTTHLTTDAYDEDATSPAFALLVKPWEKVSLYANYIEGITQGSTAPFTAANAGQVFSPFKSKQYEVGAKVDWGRITTTTSLFQISQPSTLTDPATNVFGPDGKQRNRGVELQVFGELHRTVRLLGGASYIDGELVRTAGGTNDGNTAVGTPEYLVNLGAEWDPLFAPGLTLSTRALHTSSQYVDASNSRKVPDWTRCDLGARYRVLLNQDHAAVFRVNIENLFDKDYWASAQNSLALSAPRTLAVSASYDF